ncbi:head-tail adaptor protein [Salipiger sp.]|uniref:head-tail adaptor protein n=1 Tax=Salipiger sp. TaxID=2078585 RepID=UPI003A985F3A
MAGPGAGQFRYKVQFRRATRTDDGISEVETWADFGIPVRARRRDASDTERWRAAEVGATISARFVVRWSDLAAGITARDRLVCDGREYDLMAPREVFDRRRRYIEFSATARADQ